MGDGEAVGRLEVVHVVVQVERLLSAVLVGVVQLDSEPERTVLLHGRAHKESPCKEREMYNQDQSLQFARSYLCVCMCSAVTGSVTSRVPREDNLILYRAKTAEGIL